VMAGVVVQFAVLGMRAKRATRLPRQSARRAQISFDFAQDKLSLAKSGRLRNNGKLHHYAIGRWVDNSIYFPLTLRSVCLARSQQKQSEIECSDHDDSSDGALHSDSKCCL
jgi:hypothetical protein